MSGELWIVGGSNGAGKTTAVSTPDVRRLLSGVTFLNPDAVTLNKLRSIGYSTFSDVPDDELRGLYLASANETESEMADRLVTGGRVGVETVLSSRKYIPHVERLIEAGGLLRLIYVSLRSADIAVRRVASREQSGGHGVPEDKVRGRFVRSHKLLPWFLSRAATGFVFDNSSSEPGVGPSLVARSTNGTLTFRDASADIAPELAAALDAVVAGPVS